MGTDSNRPQKRAKPSAVEPLIAWPAFLAVYEALYVLKGASCQEAKRLGALMSEETIKRYQTAWAHFLAHLEVSFLPEELGMRKLHSLRLASADTILNNLLQVLQALPLWKMCLFLDFFYKATSLAQVRNLYSALVNLPPFRN